MVSKKLKRCNMKALYAVVTETVHITVRDAVLMLRVNVWRTE